MSRTGVFAADLLKLLRELPAELHEAGAQIAGFHREELEQQPTSRTIELTVGPQERSEPDTPPDPTPAEPAPAGSSGQIFWRVASDLTDPDQPEQPPPAPGWLQEPADFNEARFVSARAGDGSAPPAAAPLVSPERLASFVSAHLRPRLAGAEPDVPRAVHRMATARPLQPWPRKVQRKWPGTVHVVLDASMALTPFRHDLLHLLGLLQRVLEQRLRLVCTPNGEPDGWLHAPHLAASVPADGSPVVVLGDAGCYRQRAGLHQRWCDLARTLARGSTRPLLLAPLPQRLVPDEVRETFDVVLLDHATPLRLLTRRPGAVPDDAEQAPQQQRHQHGVALLRAALFGNSHVGWPLVRRLRRVLQQAGQSPAGLQKGDAPSIAVDIGTEAELWQDAGVCVTATACALAAEQVEPARALLLQWHTTHPALVAELAGCHLDALAHASPLVRALYISEAASAGLLPADRLPPLQAEADDLLTHAARCLHHTPGTQSARRLQGALRDFIAGLSLRAPGAIGRGSDRLQTAWAVARQDDLSQGRAELPEGLSANLLQWLLPPATQPHTSLCLLVTPDLQRSSPSAPAFQLELLPDDDRHPCPAALVRHISAAAFASVTAQDEPATSPARLLNLDTPLPLDADRTYRIRLGQRELLIEAFRKPGWTEAVWFEQNLWRAGLDDGRELVWVPRQNVSVIDGEGRHIFPLPHGAWWHLDGNNTGNLPLRASRPSWAARHGADEFGYWAEFEIHSRTGNTITQRMRFIPPGEFLMGSPESELERYSNEQQHQVMLTNGFWLAATTCTQELWEAVTGYNPSKFNEDTQNPVEQVSWDDIVTTFLPKLNKMIPRLDLELPTEAQWEYACRAGKQTPFWFGHQINTEQVNYHGSYPYAYGTKGENRKRTISTIALPKNGWGLYQMHGNVREWCVDTLIDYQQGDVIDPKILPLPQDQIADQHVLRGGSWNNNGRICRSASRSSGKSNDRHSFFGFRLTRRLADPPDTNAEVKPSSSKRK